MKFEGLKTGEFNVITGRRNARTPKPAIQNIPIRTELGKQMRKAVKAHLVKEQ